MPVPLAVVGVRERQTASVGGGMKRACRSPVAAVVLLVFALRAVRASSRLAFAAAPRSLAGAWRSLRPQDRHGPRSAALFSRPPLAAGFRPAPARLKMADDPQLNERYV